MDRPFKAKYSTVSQVLLLLVVALFHEYLTLSIKEFLSFPVREAELRDVTYFAWLHALKTGLPVAVR